MIGRSILADVPAVERDSHALYGAPALYDETKRAPYVLAPQNLILPKNVNNLDNQPRMVSVNVLPKPTQQAQMSALVSHYTFLPVGSRNLAPRGFA